MCFSYHKVIKNDLQIDILYTLEYNTYEYTNKDGKVIC